MEGEIVMRGEGHCERVEGEGNYGKLEEYPYCGRIEGEVHSATVGDKLITLRESVRGGLKKEA